MNQLKFHLMGWENPQLDQISRIRVGMINNNVILTEESPHFIYAHDSSVYDKAINFHIYCKHKGWNTKLLLKCLDLAVHNKSDFSWEKANLLNADLILANSNYVQKQIKELLGLESYVVYDCIKELEDHNLPFSYRHIDFLMIGRLADLNKRAELGRQVYDLFEGNRTLVGCGPEPFRFEGANIKHFGVINDDGLKCLYNNSKYVLCLSKIEGLLLTNKEACNSSIPIQCSDLSTNDEWDLKELICEPNAISIKNKILEIEQNYNYYLSKCKNYYKQIIWPKYNKNQIAKNIISAYQTLI